MYHRTQNENGTYNTRCLYCFMTVASAVESECDLDLIEKHHLCPERVLSSLLGNPPADQPDVRSR
jgi:hypothetical protein